MRMFGSKKRGALPNADTVGSISVLLCSFSPSHSLLICSTLHVNQSEAAVVVVVEPIDLGS